MSVDNSDHTTPIHLDDDAEKGKWYNPSSTAEEQKADRPQFKRGRPRICASRILLLTPNLPARKASTDRSSCCFAVGLVAAVLFFLITQFQSNGENSRWIPFGGGCEAD
jgi:hypothetical protein